MNDTDKEYFRLLQLILAEGIVKNNRTGVNTVGVFGAQGKFNVALDAFPILTTKKVWFKGIVHELLWFLSGSTNIKYLVDNDVHIWDEWAYAKFKKTGVIGEIDYRNDIQTQETFIQEIKRLDKNDWFVTTFGDLGEGTYGGMWRAFPFHQAKYSDWTEGQPNISRSREDFKFGVDQLQKVLDKLKSNPDDRRMIVSAWHPYWVDHCALPPCHCLFHFNTEELTVEERIAVTDRYQHMELAFKVAPLNYNKTLEEDLDELKIPRRRVNLLLYQRSCDTFLGVPFNITSYALLLAMVAHCSNMIPGVFTHTYGDLHIYENHREQVNTQLSREPLALPKLWLNPAVKDLFKFQYEDIKLVDYNCHPAIKAPVAV